MKKIHLVTSTKEIKCRCSITRLQPLSNIVTFEILNNLVWLIRQVCSVNYLFSDLICKRLFLTTGGQDYFKIIEPALDSIANATYNVAKDAKRETLTVSAPPSFIVTWLLPRIQSFLQTQPQLNLRLIDKMTLDLDDKSIDCAIEYRFEATKDVQSARLLPDEVVVLAAPDLLQKHTIDSIDSLAGIPLIETERRLVSWNVILQSYPWFQTQKILTFSYSLHAFKAAELGLGVVLGNRHNAKWYIDENFLCIPFELEAGIVPPTPRYFISLTMQKANIPKVADFTNWIKNEVGMH